MRGFDIIIEPILTEKTYPMIAEKRYGFIVQKTATKPQIKEAIEKIFGVSVSKVNTLNRLGKEKRRGRTKGYTSEVKVAYVQLKEDSRPIEYFESLV